jgi:GNAT superfamily N-acetyltransferase
MDGTLPHIVLRVLDLPPTFDALASAARAEGHRMLDVLREDWESGAIRFDGAGEALFVAYSADGMVGMIGLTRDPYMREGSAGRLRRLYVRPDQRRGGVGRALVAAAVKAGREGGWPRLRVRSPPAAFAFYEACGFLRAVGEVSATHVMPLAPASPGTP